MSGGGHGGAHASVEFAALGAVCEEIVGEGDAARFEDGDGAGATEAEHAFFSAFGDWLAGRHGLDDAADVGGADFEEEDGAEAIGFESCEDAFVFPEIGETAAEGDGADGVELAVEESWGAWGSGAGEVEAVVIDRAETAEDEGAGGVFCGEFVTAEERGEVELLTFDEDAVDLVGACEAEVAAVGREDDGGRVRVDGPCGGVEAAAEEVVEGGEGVGRVCEFRGVEMVVFDEGSDSGAAGWLVHAAAVPAGEGGAFDECGDDETADGVFVGGAEEALAVDGFLFEPAGVAVEESDRIAGHGRGSGVVVVQLEVERLTGHEEDENDGEERACGDESGVEGAAGAGFCGFGEPCGLRLVESQEQGGAEGERGEEEDPPAGFSLSGGEEGGEDEDDAGACPCGKRDGVMGEGAEGWEVETCEAERERDGGEGDPDEEGHEDGDGPFVGPAGEC